MVTVVVSAITRPVVRVAVGAMRVTIGAAAKFAFGEEDGTPGGDTVLVSRELVSLAGDIRELGVVLAGGNSSCETAITMSERNRARKKRLSIQGTGSKPPGRKG